MEAARGHLEFRRGAPPIDHPGRAEIAVLARQVERREVPGRAPAHDAHWPGIREAESRALELKRVEIEERRSALEIDRAAPRTTARRAAP